MTTQNDTRCASEEFPSGPKPGDRNTTFLDDPVSDHLLRAVVTLTMELSVSRERIKTLESLLVQSGALTQGAADEFEPTDDDAVARSADRNALIAAILDPIMEHLSVTK
ncbi:MAG: hypothetical protein AAGK17_05890 [Pseudomonadota bacterium]